LSQHLTDPLVQDFIDGDLTDAVAVQLAEHLDHCPHCSARVAHAEPLAAAFAEVQDPPLPEGLIDAILVRAANQSAPVGGFFRKRPEVWAAAGLLAAAALLLGLTGGLTPWMDEIGVSVRAAIVGGEVLVSNSPISAGAIALGATMTLALSAMLLVWRQRERRR
jgi:anti-sigma factor RsiW